LFSEEKLRVFGFVQVNAPSEFKILAMCGG